MGQVEFVLTTLVTVTVTVMVTVTVTGHDYIILPSLVMLQQER